MSGVTSKVDTACLMLPTSGASFHVSLLSLWLTERFVILQTRLISVAGPAPISALVYCNSTTLLHTLLLLQLLARAHYIHTHTFLNLLTKIP